MKFKICIPTYNAADYLDLCLYSLKKYSVWDHEYYVIMDSCKDNTEDVCKKYKVNYDKVNYSCPYKTRNHIQNIIDLSDDFYFFMTADDMFASPNWDKNIHQHMHNEKDVIWSAQLSDYLLRECFNSIKEKNPDLNVEEFASRWASGGINMDFGECGNSCYNFNEEIFLYKFKKIKKDSEIIYNDLNKEVLCNSNFLIHSYLWRELEGWPTINTHPYNPKLGKPNDKIFQENIIKNWGKNIVAQDVLFFHFGGNNIERHKNDK
jgi:glycosyltransferase involved in cell wall biosynthesis